MRDPNDVSTLIACAGLIGAAVFSPMLANRARRLSSKQQVSLYTRALLLLLATILCSQAGLTFQSGFLNGSIIALDCFCYGLIAAACLKARFYLVGVTIYVPLGVAALVALPVAALTTVFIWNDPGGPGNYQEHSPSAGLTCTERDYGGFGASNGEALTEYRELPVGLRWEIASVYVDLDNPEDYKASSHTAVRTDCW